MSEAKFSIYDFLEDEDIIDQMGGIRDAVKPAMTKVFEPIHHHNEIAELFDYKSREVDIIDDDIWDLMSLRWEAISNEIKEFIGGLDVDGLILESDEKWKEKWAKEREEERIKEREEVDKEMKKLGKMETKETQ